MCKENRLKKKTKSLFQDEFLFMKKTGGHFQPRGVARRGARQLSDVGPTGRSNSSFNDRVFGPAEKLS